MTDAAAVPTFIGAKSLTVIQELNIPEELYDGNGRVALVPHTSFMGGDWYEVKIRSLTGIAIDDESVLAAIRIETIDMFLVPQIVKSWLGTHLRVEGELENLNLYVVANQ